MLGALTSIRQLRVKISKGFDFCGKTYIKDNLWSKNRGCRQKKAPRLWRILTDHFKSSKAYQCINQEHWLLPDGSTANIIKRVGSYHRWMNNDWFLTQTGWDWYKTARLAVVLQDQFKEQAVTIPYFSELLTEYLHTQLIGSKKHDRTGIEAYFC